jgi:tryptophanyl-tRNA synthetase
MARVFSGIKPTGEVQLGNYLGAIRRWVDDQPAAGSEAARNHEAIFCVVDLHALTVPWDPKEVERLTRHIATMLMAAGLEEDRSLLFVQSHVRAHAELTWILNCVAGWGELRRMTQFKDKSESQDFVSVGLFDYPVLMASDILLYDTEQVPVGDDQRQHVELTRDIALRFNHHYGKTFVVPSATFPEVGARVMDLQNPTKKMSKSADSPMGCVYVLDPPKTIIKKIKSAVTDSGSEVRHDRDEKPGVSNLIEIYAAVTGKTIVDVEHEFEGQQYGSFKAAVADAVVAFLEPVQTRYEQLRNQPEEVEARLARGASTAEAIADEVLDRASRAAGLLRRAK